MATAAAMPDAPTCKSLRRLIIVEFLPDTFLLLVHAVACANASSTGFAEWRVRLLFGCRLRRPRTASERAAHVRIRHEETYGTTIDPNHLIGVARFRKSFAIAPNYG